MKNLHWGGEREELESRSSSSQGKDKLARREENTRSRKVKN